MMHEPVSPEQPMSANELFKSLETKKRDPIPYTGPMDPAEFAPPSVSYEPVAAKAQSKAVEAPDGEGKPEGKSQAQTKSRARTKDGTW